MFGTVYYFNPRGFAFIRPSDESEDVFAHVSQFDLPGEYGKKAVAVGIVVEFELGTRNGKSVARNVRIVDALVGATSDGGNVNERN